MLVLVLVTFINLFVTVFNFLLIARVLMSFFAGPDNSLYGWLVNVTEPVLAPVRRVLPQTPGIDLAPLVAFFVLQGFQYLANWLLSGIAG